MYCKHCGKLIDEDYSFCRFCGKPKGIKGHTDSSFEEPNSSTGMANGHEWVDLGLSVKWATCNIGAKEPTDKGQFFAWGETETKGFYSKDTYKLNSFWGGYKKTGNNIAGTKYDAAKVQWGGLWRMPTKEEMQELIDCCSWKWSTLIVEGCIVSGNNNHIFLPYTKAMSGGGFLGNASGSYWTDTLASNAFTGCTSYMWGLVFLGSDLQRSEQFIDRWDGLLIRPVLDWKF